MGALKMGIPEEDLPDIVARWRDANKRIRDLWYKMDAAAVQVIQQGGAVGVSKVIVSREFDLTRRADCLTITLPSGRKLYYVDPQLGINRWDKPSISYMGVNDKNKWGRVETYGGKLVENVVQAIARDCLAQAIEHLEAAGLPVIFHIHDEVVIDCPPDAATLDDVVKIMTRPIPWAQDLPLGADGWVGKFFKKD
jgi:DNA polymerase